LQASFQDINELPDLFLSETIPGFNKLNVHRWDRISLQTHDSIF